MKSNSEYAQQLAAANRLTSAEFKPLMDMMRSRAKDAEARLAKADDVKVIYRLQGVVNVYSEFISLVENSQNKLNELSGGR